VSRVPAGSPTASSDTTNTNGDLNTDTGKSFCEHLFSAEPKLEMPSKHCAEQEQNEAQIFI